MMNKLIDQQASSEKPYPRRCCECGEVNVQAVKIAKDVKIKHDGKLHEFHISQLPVDQCKNCGEVFFTNETSDAKSEALRTHLGLLQPSEIKSFLSQYRLTQRGLAQHLGVAEESVSRWINGLSIQSRALDRFMRVYFASKEARKLLSSETVKLETTGMEAATAFSITLSEEYRLGSADVVHPIFNRCFSAATMARSRRFRLVPTEN